MQVIDNFLPEDDFLALQSAVLSEKMQWYFAPCVGIEGVNNSEGHYTHNIFVDGVINDVVLFHFIINMLKPKNIGEHIWRMRLISFSKTSEIIHHETHQDAPLSHTGLLIYMNTNNGFTNHDSGEQIKSVENRALIHDPSKPHNSTTCTDAQRRVVLTINYL